LCGKVVQGVGEALDGEADVALLHRSRVGFRVAVEGGGVDGRPLPQFFEEKVGRGDEEFRGEVSVGSDDLRQQLHRDSTLVGDLDLPEEVGAQNRLVDVKESTDDELAEGCRRRIFGEGVAVHEEDREVDCSVDVLVPRPLAVVFEHH